MKYMMFIDSNNFYKNAEALLNISKPKFRWADLVIGIRNKIGETIPEGWFVCANYYTALSDRADNPVKYDAQVRFIDALRRVPFIRVVVGYLMKKQRDTAIPIDINDPNTYIHVEKNTDVNLSNDVIENVLRGNIEIVIFVAADGDYAGTVNKVKEYGAVCYLVLPLGAKAQMMKSLIGINNVIYVDDAFLTQYLVP